MNGRDPGADQGEVAHPTGFEPVTPAFGGQSGTARRVCFARRKSALRCMVSGLEKKTTTRLTSPHIAYIQIDWAHKTSFGTSRFDLYPRMPNQNQTNRLSFDVASILARAPIVSEVFMISSVRLQLDASALFRPVET